MVRELAEADEKPDITLNINHGAILVAVLSIIYSNTTTGCFIRI